MEFLELLKTPEPLRAAPPKRAGLFPYLPGIWLGRHTTGRVPDKVLRPALAAILVLAGHRRERACPVDIYQYPWYQALKSAKYA